MNVIRWGAVGLAMILAMAGCASEAPAGGDPAPADPPAVALPDPTPGGPVRPDEPEVPGPDNLDSIEMTVQPDGGAVDGIQVTFDKTSRTASGEKPSAARRYVFLFDRAVEFAPEAFPTCERAVLASQGVEGCPPESKVGSGWLENYPSGRAEVAVFNTRYPNGLYGVLITVPASGLILENTLEPVAGPYRDQFGFGLDEILPPTDVPPAERSATTRFHVTFGATRTEGNQTYSYLRSSAASGAPLRFGLWSEFVTGQVIQPAGEALRP